MLRPPILLALLASVAFAEPASDPRGLLDAWLGAQNRGDFEGYQALYASSFSGVRRSGKKTVKLDRAGWIADRERMFRARMTVAADEVVLEPRGAGWLVRFRQTWASGRYRDTGTKELELVVEDGLLRIAREEMLESKVDHGIRAAGLLVWEAGRPDETGGALESAEKLAAALAAAIDFPAGFPTALEGKVDGVKPGESVVALGVCTAAELSAVLDLFRALGARVHARETGWRPRADGSSCPVWRRNPETGGGWSWGGVSAAAGPLTVVALRADHELGDFARAYRENLFVAALRARDGSVRVAAFAGRGDFADLESLEADGAAVIARERFVDAPCDGTDDHRFVLAVRTLRFEVSHGDIAQRELGKPKVLERGRCSDEEKRLVSPGGGRR